MPEIRTSGLSDQPFSYDKPLSNKQNKGRIPVKTPLFRGFRTDHTADCGWIYSADISAGKTCVIVQRELLLPNQALPDSRRLSWR
jgi:hypothetical protein